MQLSRYEELLPDRFWWLLQCRRGPLLAVAGDYEAYEDERYGVPGVAIVFRQVPFRLTLFLDARQRFALHVDGGGPDGSFTIEGVRIVNRPARIFTAVKRSLGQLPAPDELPQEPVWEAIHAIWRPLLIRKV